MAICNVDKVIIQKEISKKEYTLKLSEREARELILIVGGVSGSIGDAVYLALDKHFGGRSSSLATWKYTDIGQDALDWAAEGDDD